nr:hypothetical protein [Tanacetum cinerariifolium]
EATKFFLMRELRELGFIGVDNGSPRRTHGLPLTINEICGIAKSAVIVPSELNQDNPRMTSAPATGIMNIGTLNLVLLISSGVEEIRELHSKK